MGNNDDAGEETRVECTYDFCRKLFPNRKQMKRHKKAEPGHFYCKKCDVDCKDWEDELQHKVNAMQPFLENRMKDEPDAKLMHIVCEFCGKDFGSFGGRKRHREQTHQAEQQITCPGCKYIFVKAGNLVAHYERGECQEITKRQFLGAAQHKHVQQGIHANGNLKAIPDNIAKNQMIAASESDTNGGVNLLDNEDEEQKEGLEPLKAEQNLMQFHEPPRAIEPKPEEWPQLGSHKDLTPYQQAALHAAMKKCSIAPVGTHDAITPPIDRTLSTKESLSHDTSRRGSDRVYAMSQNSVRSTSQTAQDGNIDDAASELSTAIDSTADSTVACTTGNTSEVTFKGGRAPPPPTDYQLILQQREQHALAASDSSLLTSRWWDPNCPSFNLSMFRNALTKQYECPWDECQGDAIYDLDVDLLGHMYFAHVRRQFRCPSCLKIFKNASGLISHSEAAGKCKVKESDKYQQLLDEVSGGFLKTQELRQPKIAKANKDGEMEGIMGMKFEAQIPDEFPAVNGLVKYPDQNRIELQKRR